MSHILNINISDLKIIQSISNRNPISFSLPPLKTNLTCPPRRFKQHSYLTRCNHKLLFCTVSVLITVSDDIKVTSSRCAALNQRLADELATLNLRKT